MANANNGDTIAFALSYPATIVVTSELSNNYKNLTILGPGTNQLTISGGNWTRVFGLHLGSLSISNLTIADGLDYHEGGAIFSYAIALDINNVTFANNHVGCGAFPFCSNGQGGAIRVYQGTVNIANSTFDSNSVNAVGDSMFGFGEASANGGAISGYVGTINITNSTFVNNSANADSTNGDPMFASADAHGGTIEGYSVTINIINSTFSGNGAYATGINPQFRGGTIYEYGATIALTNSIITNTTSGTNCFGSIINNGNNLQYGDCSCPGFLFGDPKLGPLADNGGPTQTLALQAGSAALGAGNQTVCNAAPVNNLDQRGQSRPQGHGNCDIGAYESSSLASAALPCGNGVLEMCEGCDDGGNANGDGCNATCLVENGSACNTMMPGHIGASSCESGICDPTSNTCEPPGCGNGNVEAPEACDDGNTADGDGCNSVCLREIGLFCFDNNMCASGFCDPADYTCACDEDSDCAMGDLCYTMADPNVCVAPGCGNNVLEAGEACDDGNTASGDCCSPTCAFESAATVCRAAAAPCDSAEMCTGTSATCPADAVAPDGTSCDDGDLCTQSDSCQSGMCTAGTPVVCTAQDECHDAGTCDSMTGCSNPNKIDGSSCDDNDACTQSDSCQSGMCTAGTPVVCTAQDECHDAGTCDSMTGLCSDPNKIDGSSCDDGDLCTQTDSCQSGMCTAGIPVVCTATDPCQDVDKCDKMTGMCHYVPKFDGSPCDDGDKCTESDKCQSGTCVGTPMTCPATDQCYDAGTCDSMTGNCIKQNKADGSSCDDGDLCTQSDSCQSGTCTGANPVTCSAQDECHEVGTCDPSSGTCPNTAKPDGSPCTNGGTCQDGACVLRCTSNADCPELFECVENKCQPLSEGPLDSAPGCTCRAAGANGSGSQTMGMTLLALTAYLARRRRTKREHENHHERFARVKGRRESRES